ncbi:MAG: DoxX family membrane protein [Bacteroidota bacterium]|nr:DoxX family membrane protein [Bacteroidota bacterium]
MTHPLISRISVIILGIVLIVFGIYHFVAPENLMAYVPDFLPGGKLWVYLAGAAFILAAIAFIIHKQVRLAAYLLAFLLLIFILAIHLPNVLHAGSAEVKQLELVNLLKDTALAAFALYIGSNAKSFE